jgi:hypothetical protein
MNLLDENIDDGEWQRLRRWRIRARKIGAGLGRKGMTDEDIIPLLHHLKSVTLLTYDAGYYKRHLCHARYCLVYLDMDEELTADTIRRFLRHPAFRTWARRRGKVIWVRYSGMRVWQLRAEAEESVAWTI